MFAIYRNLFLSPYSMCVITFSMSEMLRDEEGCLRDIVSFVNSVTAQTFNEQILEMASIVILGTHKDEVPAVAEHERISLLLQNRLQKSEAWTRGFLVNYNKAIL